MLPIQPMEDTHVAENIPRLTRRRVRKRIQTDRARGRDIRVWRGKWHGEDG